jgi:hypothetical protein
MKRKMDAMTDEKHPRLSTRIVLNKCHGGFGLSSKAKDLLMGLLGYTQYDSSMVSNVLAEIPRHDPVLLHVVEHLGNETWVPFHLDEYIHRPVIVEIPVAESDYEILYKDGWEVAIPKNFENLLFPSL